jgi:hypothetical protein
VKTRTSFIVAALALLSAPVSAFACEPIVPFIKAISGPRLLTVSFVILGVVVLLKSAAFARFQNKISFTKALLWMFAANVFTSIIGIVAPAMVESGGAAFIAVPVVWALCLLPAQRFLVAFPLSRFARYSPRELAFGITAVLVFSYLLLIVSGMVRDSAGFALYWIVKFPALYIALFIGIAVTAFWEEWIVWRFSRSDEEDVSFVQPVIRANLVVLAAVVLFSAGLLIPKRLKNPVLVGPGHSQFALQPSQSSH